MIAITTADLNFTNKVCAVDFDGTLVFQQSNANFPEDADDWQAVFKNCKDKLQQYHNDGWMLVIFTNQSGVSKGHVKINDVKKRLTSFIGYIGVPIQVFIATNNDKYRKPHTHMWRAYMEFLIKSNIHEKEIMVEQVIFVGDAAGRIKTKKNKKDFSCSDRKFAYNIGRLTNNVINNVKFFTPEEFFIGKDDRNSSAELWSWDCFDPEQYLIKNIQETVIEPNKYLEMILLIGPPGSGKSTFAINFCDHHKQYIRVNQDTLKTKEKCIAATNKAINDKKSVIIDNTNADINTRKIYTDIARQENYSIRYIHFDIEKEMAIHLDEMRVELGEREETIPIIVFHTYYKKLRDTPISHDEYDELITYNWILDDKNKNQFLMRF